MLIVGAQGFAIEILEILHQNNQLKHLVFYDDVNIDGPETLFEKFEILKSLKAAECYFKTKDSRFTLGIGNPILRKNLYEKFTAIGGVFTSTISSEARIGFYDVKIGLGCNILSGSVFSNSSQIGMGCIIYYNTTITHHCLVGDFVEIAPSVNLLGRCRVGNYTKIGANVTILPDVIIGENVVIGAGAVVTKDIPDNAVIFGIPAKVIRQMKPLKF